MTDRRQISPRETHRVLAALHPELFSLDHPRPFKLGIRHDLRDLYPEITNMQSKDLFSWLCSRRAYLVACWEGAPRWGFGGPNGFVTAEQALRAREVFQRRNERAVDKWPVSFVVDDSGAITHVQFPATVEP